MKLSKDKRKLKENEEETTENLRRMRYKKLSRESVDTALSWYDSQILKNPTDTGLYFAKGSLLAKEGRYEEAVDVLNKVLELDPDNQRVLEIKAHALCELGFYEKALECFDKLTSISDDEMLWNRKGEVLTKLKRYEEAINSYDRAIELDRNYTEAWYGRGNAQRRLNEMRKQLSSSENVRKDVSEGLNDAMDSYSTAMELNPNYNDAWHGMGETMYALENFKKAIPYYNKSVSITPTYIKGWLGKGKTLLKLERVEDARNSFNKVIEHYPNTNIDGIEALGAKANALFELGNYEEALSCFDEILKYYPNNNFALEGKASMLEKIDKHDEALECYKKAIELNSKDGVSMFKVGEIQERLGQPENALRSYQMAVETVPNFDHARYKMALLQKQLKRYEDANKNIKKVLKADPKHEEALKVREEIKGLVKHVGKEIRKESKIKPLRSHPTYESQSPSTEDNNTFQPLELKTSMQKVKPTLIEAPSKILREEPIKDSQSDTTIGVERAFVSLVKSLLEDTSEMMIKRTNYGGDEEHSVSLEEQDGSQSWADIGEIFIEKKDYNRAIQALDRALEQDEFLEDVLTRKGDALLELNRLDEATECYRKAMNISLRNMSKFHKMGMATPLSKIDKEWEREYKSLLMEMAKDEEGEVIFDCPVCTSRVEVGINICHSCGTIFIEEKFTNRYGKMDDDLVFFDELQQIITEKRPLFIHLDNDKGTISYLEGRLDPTTRQEQYFIVRGNIEQMSWDYSPVKTNKK